MGWDNNIPDAERKEAEIRGLATTGAICEVYGHWWPDKNTPCVDGARHFVRRTCKLCGVSQEAKQIIPLIWEDAE